MLTIENLNKNYGKFTAVKELNLHIPKGEIFGFVGPNGAGKTTTMKIICGLLKATSGSVSIDGVDALNYPRRVKDKIGYMPDFFGVYDDLKVTEYLDFYAAIYGIRGAEKDKICSDLLELVDLQDKRESYVDSLSRGMKQRLCLARSLVHNPELLILDEPASGMDPRARVEMKEILRTLKSMGKTIIVSSHILPELSELCTSIGIIERGQMVISGRVEEIMDKVYAQKTVKLKILGEGERAMLILREYPLVDKVKESGGGIQFNFHGGEEELVRLLKDLILREIPVSNFTSIDENLEDVFMKVTSDFEDSMNGRRA